MGHPAKSTGPPSGTMRWCPRGTYKSRAHDVTLTLHSVQTVVFRFYSQCSGKEGQDMSLVCRPSPFLGESRSVSDLGESELDLVNAVFSAILTASVHGKD